MRKTDLLSEIKPVFYVIWFNPNLNIMEPYNVIPYFINEYKETKKSKRPKTLEEFKEFIRDKSMYMFWSRCQYEIVLSDWPCSGISEKWDVHRQILNNIDLVTIILYNAIKNIKILNDTSSI